VEALRPDGEMALERLRQQASQRDLTLLQTVRDALGELDGLESELRRRLAALAPGDPEGEVDLEAMRAKLAEAAARREVASVAGPLVGTQSAAVGEPLVLQVSDPDWGAALMMGIFSLGWNAFTTFHAFMMIGGMFRALGIGALALLLFYSIFWFVGGTMAWSAIQSAANEKLSLNGWEMTLHRWLGPIRWEKRYTLGPDSKVYLNTPVVKNRNSQNGDLAVRDAQGKLIRFGGTRPRPEQPWLRDKINTYLSALTR
jgi:hypothetical protein